MISNRLVSSRIRTLGCLWLTSMDFGLSPPLPLHTGQANHTDQQKAAEHGKQKPPTKTKMAASTNSRLDAVPQVDIDDSGRFKYILIKLWEKDHTDENSFKYLVRGYGWAGFHMDIYDEVVQRVSPLGLDTECVGGGRILHEPNKKKIFVYGYSQGFGRANHQIVCDLLKKKYPLYTDISWSDEGY